MILFDVFQININWNIIHKSICWDSKIVFFLIWKEVTIFFINKQCSFYKKKKKLISTIPIILSHIINPCYNHKLISFLGNHGLMGNQQGLSLTSHSQTYCYEEGCWNVLNLTHFLKVWWNDQKSEFGWKGASWSMQQNFSGPSHHISSFWQIKNHH